MTVITELPDTNGARAPAPSPPGTALRPVVARSPGRIAVGSALTAAAVIAAVFVYGGLGDRALVLAVARPVAAGERIGANDLREVRVAADRGVATIPATDLDATVGRVAAVGLVAGSLLTPEALATGPLAPTGSAVIGATMKAGQYPLELRAGRRVEAVVVPATAAAGDRAAFGAPVAATVTAVGSPANDGSLPISLAVSPADAPRLSVAAADARLVLYLAAP